MKRHVAMIARRKPPWWQIYTLVPVLGVLCLLEHRAPLTRDWHIGVQAGIVCVIYGLIWRWLRANAYTLMTGPGRDPRHDFNSISAVRNAMELCLSMAESCDITESRKGLSRVHFDQPRKSDSYEANGGEGRVRPQ
jgi:hypothetical protein